MATPARRFIQDQNSSFLYTGATLGTKTDSTKAEKKPMLGGRKALNDISNSRKTSVLLQSTKKEISANVISIEKDPVAPKAQCSKALETGKSRGRKALSDLTNSVKPSSVRQVSSKFGQKLNVIAEKEKLPCSELDEGFLHDHRQCVKAQRKAVDVDYFLASVGLRNDMPLVKRSVRASSDKAEIDKRVIINMEEIPEQHFDDCQRSQRQKLKLLGDDGSPICYSPKSPKSPPYLMNWENDDLSDLTLIESPKLLCP